MLPGTAVVHTCYSSYIYQYTRHSTWYILLPMLLLLLAASCRCCCTWWHWPGGRGLCLHCSSWVWWRQHLTGAQTLCSPVHHQSSITHHTRCRCNITESREKAIKDDGWRAIATLVLNRRLTTITWHYYTVLYKRSVKQASNHDNMTLLYCTV